MTSTICIRFRENGSVVIDLPAGTTFELDGREQRLSRPKLALCRCGHSEQKPFCDGSHKRMGFQAREARITVPVIQGPTSSD